MKYKGNPENYNFYAFLLKDFVKKLFGRNLRGIALSYAHREQSGPPKIHFQKLFYYFRKMILQKSTPPPRAGK